MDVVDYYDTLGVAADAEPAAIKAAYRKLARRYHPDVSTEADAEARFKVIGEAWSVLKNAERRAEYDQLRERIARGEYSASSEGAQRPWDTGGGVGPDPFAGGFTDADASDFFSDLFGARAAGARGFGGGRPGGSAGGPARGRERRGEDAHVSLTIDLETAFAGARLPLTLRVPDYADDGTVRLEEKTLRVTIPAGTLAGRKLRLAGQGGPGPGDAPAGDLYIEIVLEPNERYTLDGRNIDSVVEVLPWQAALGATLEVQTLGGSVQMRVPPGSSGGRRLRLRGRGMPGEPPGDHVVTLRVHVPTPTNDVQRAAWEALRAAHDDPDDESESDVSEERP